MDSHSDYSMKLLSRHGNSETTSSACHISTTLPETVSHTSAEPTTQHSSGAAVNTESYESAVAHLSDDQFDKWKIALRNPSLMATFLLLGTGCAIVHHLYYGSLDRLSIDAVNQEWAVRIGTGLAFLIRAFLVASAAMGFQHYSWLILRKASLSIGTIDDLVGILDNLIPFINFELWRSALGVILVACIIW